MEEQEHYRVLIVGAGMGGVTAALWCRRLGLSFRLLERSRRVGGELQGIQAMIPDFPGFQGSGEKLAEQLEEQVESLSLPLVRGAEVLSLSLEGKPDQEGRGARVVLRTRESLYQGEALILATGLQRRMPFPEDHQRGIFYNVQTELEQFRGRRVAIVGGGDGAFENALRLRAVAREVSLLYRGTTPGARSLFQEQLRQEGGVRLLYETEVKEVRGDPLRSLLLATREGERELECDRLLVKVGFEPRSGLVQGLCALTPDGYVRVGQRGRTDRLPLWAVGDVATPEHPSLARAVGQAYEAVRDVERYLQGGGQEPFTKPALEG